MNTRTLINTNPYLQNSERAKELILRSVKTSCGVEGIKVSSNIKPFYIPNRRIKQIYQTIKE